MDDSIQARSHAETCVGAGQFRYRVEAVWDMFPGDGPHGEAVAVACDRRNRVYVFLRGPRPVRIYEQDGSFVNSWGEGQFVRPHGIFVGPDDTVYCTDDFDHSVRAFTTDGRLLLTLGTRGRPSDTGTTSIDYRNIRRSAGPFHFPTNLAIGLSGDLFVSDGYGNARVHRFAADGRLLQSWGQPGGGPGQFHVPHGIAVDSDGTVYVADRENSRIQLFTPKGEFLGEWTDVARPCQIFVDPRQPWIYVAELGFRAGRWPGTGSAEPGATGGRISIFDRAGALQARWGGGNDACAPGDFFAPHGLWVDSQGDLYVAEVALSAGGRTGLVAASCHTLQKFVRTDSSAHWHSSADSPHDSR
jgi:DNA-binding beta-propeller fold protein YncE